MAAGRQRFLLREMLVHLRGFPGRVIIVELLPAGSGRDRQHSAAICSHASALMIS
jgi:hypothetical protein